MKDQEYNYFYDDNYDKEYCYLGTNVLENKLNIGDFSIKHLCTIHKHQQKKKCLTQVFSQQKQIMIY